MANWLRLQKRTSLLILSFFASCLYRTITGVWPFGSPANTIVTSTRGETRGLLFPIGRSSQRGGHDARQYALEVNGSFPFLHLQSLAPGLASVAVTHPPCISTTTGDLKVNAMQFGVAQSSACNLNPNPGNQALFSSNPVPASTNYSPIAIGEPAPGGGESGPGAGGGQGCGGCGVPVSCGGLPEPFCYSCCYTYGFCEGPC